MSIRASSGMANPGQCAGQFEGGVAGQPERVAAGPEPGLLCLMHDAMLDPQESLRKYCALLFLALLGSSGMSRKPWAPTMSTEILKALANPLRRQVWNEVSELRYARAADLSKRLDAPANTLSFHLRVLAEAGLIEEAPGERATSATGYGSRPGARSPRLPENPVADATLGDIVLAGTVADHQQLLQRVAGWALKYATGETRRTGHPGRLHPAPQPGALHRDDRTGRRVDQRVPRGG